MPKKKSTEKVEEPKGKRWDLRVRTTTLKDRQLTMNTLCMLLYTVRTKKVHEGWAEENTNELETLYMYACRAYWGD